MSKRKKALPYPIGSIVLYEGRKYIVDEIGSYGTDYSLLGHKGLGTKGFGTAWIYHDDLTFVSEPTSQNWKWLISARGEDE